MRFVTQAWLDLTRDDVLRLRLTPPLVSFLFVWLKLITVYTVEQHRSYQSSAVISLNVINQLIFVKVKCRVFFEVTTEFFNIM
jgi:hypothetical protein